MSPDAFSNGLLSIVNGMALPVGTFDPNRLHNAKISLALRNGINTNDGEYFDGAAAHEVTINGYFRITYQHINGQYLTIDSVQKTIGIEEYYGHGVLGLFHPKHDAVIKTLLKGYPYE